MSRCTGVPAQVLYDNMPDWKLTFNHAVASTPLERYEKLIDPQMARAEMASDAARPMAGMEVAL